MTKAITPQECIKEEGIDPTIAEIVNDYLVRRFSKSGVRIKQKEIVSSFLSIKREDSTWTSERIYEEHLLDIEDFYREAGWKVEYDKPGYCETYDEFFIFKPKS